MGRPTARGLVQRVRDFGTVVREGMAEREAELRSALGIDTGTDTRTDTGIATGTIDDRAARELLEDPTSPRR